MLTVLGCPSAYMPSVAARELCYSPDVKDALPSSFIKKVLCSISVWIAPVNDDKVPPEPKRRPETFFPRRRSATLWDTIGSNQGQGLKPGHRLDSDLRDRI